MAATHSYGLLPTIIGVHVIFLLISLTIAPVCKGDETFCEKIRKKTSSPHLCTDILLKAPHSFSTIPQIQKHLLRVGEDNEDRMVEHYQLRRKEAADDRVVSECEKLHVDSSFAYVDAYEDYKYKRYDGVKKNLSKVLENCALCPLASNFAKKNSFEAKIATLNRELINMDGHEQ